MQRGKNWTATVGGGGEGGDERTKQNKKQVKKDVCFSQMKNVLCVFQL